MATLRRTGGGTYRGVDKGTGEGLTVPEGATADVSDAGARYLCETLGNQWERVEELRTTQALPPVHNTMALAPEKRKPGRPRKVCHGPSDG